LRGIWVENSAPLIGIIMGSRSDWETMREASSVLAALGVAHECKVLPHAASNALSQALAGLRICPEWRHR
jgi:phosphoribosylcarboxyaminoimidazole (NCAIR) mutase